MRTISTRHFGSVALAARDDDTYVTRDVTLAGVAAQRSLYVGAGLGTARLAGVVALLDELEALDARARTALRGDLAGGEETVADFLSFHLEELPEGMAAVLEGEPATPGALLERTSLCGVSAHLRPEGFVLVLDYSPGSDHTDQRLAVSFDASGAVVGVTHES